jgi:UDP-glucose 4-epimerase
LPVWGQISKIEIEAWQVFIQQLYSTFIKKSNLNFRKNIMQNKKTILITWGTGYIGSHWVVAFEQAGYKTVIVDNLSNSSLETLDGIEKILAYKPDFFEVDLRNKEKLKEIFEKYDFDGVIHFAWLKAVWESCEKPLEYFDNNIVGSIKLFELMEEFWVKNIVFSSSATVYSPENSSPLVETMTTWNTSNPYW